MNDKRTDRTMIYVGVFVILLLFSSVGVYFFFFKGTDSTGKSGETTLSQPSPTDASQKEDIMRYNYNKEYTDVLMDVNKDFKAKMAYAEENNFIRITEKVEKEKAPELKQQEGQLKTFLQDNFVKYDPSEPGYMNSKQFPYYFHSKPNVFFIGGDMIRDMKGFTDLNPNCAVVNAANEAGLGGGGLDLAIHGMYDGFRKDKSNTNNLRDVIEKAYPQITAGKSARILTGGCLVSNGHPNGADDDANISKFKYIFHAVGPDCVKSPNSFEKHSKALKQAYFSVCLLAKHLNVSTLYLPLLSGAIYEFTPPERHAETMRDFFNEMDKVLGNDFKTNLVFVIYLRKKQSKSFFNNYIKVLEGKEKKFN